MKKLGFTGDIALSGIIRNFDAVEISNNLNISRICPGAGLIINLESPAVDVLSKPVKNKGVILYTYAEILREFIRTNKITCVSLANNHILDFGNAGVRTTINVLNEFGIPFSGAGFIREHLDPAIFSLNGEEYALLSYVHASTNPFRDELSFLNIYNPDEIRSMIKEIKPHTDHVIISLHWGTDYSHYQEKWQVTDARSFIDYGASVVVGHHSHTLQPFEEYNNGFIFYNLGSLIFGDFILDGRLRALRINTKRSFIPLFENLIERPLLVPTREKKGNILIADKRNIKRWARRRMIILNLKNHMSLLDHLIRFSENIPSRILDILTGYYRNPFREIFKISNIRRTLTILRK